MDNPGSQNVASCKPVTTFVQTDTKTFRAIVQRLTGPSENIAGPELTAVKATTPKSPTSKLHERRQCMRPKLEIVKPPLGFKSIGKSPSPKSRNTGFLTSPVGTPSKLFSNLSIVEEDNVEPDVLFPLTSPNARDKA